MIWFSVLLFVITVAVAVHPGYYGQEGFEGGPAPYKFSYGVADPHTGDFKQQHEFADGHGGVKGAYSLKEPDGTTRLVEYLAGPHTGFNAVVKRIGHAHHPQHYKTYGGIQGGFGAGGYGGIGVGGGHGGYGGGHGGYGGGLGGFGGAQSHVGVTHYGYH